MKRDHCRLVHCKLRSKEYIKLCILCAAQKGSECSAAATTAAALSNCRAFVSSSSTVDGGGSVTSLLSLALSPSALSLRRPKPKSQLRFIANLCCSCVPANKPQPLMSSRRRSSSSRVSQRDLCQPQPQPLV